MFPWAASGRALGMGRSEGMTKLILEPETKRVLGAGIVGRQRRGADRGDRPRARDGGRRRGHRLTIHPHPTLSETLGMAAEVGLGTITDLPPKRSKSPR